MGHETDIELSTPTESPPGGDADRHLRGIEIRLEQILGGVREARRRLRQAQRHEQAIGLADLAGALGDLGDAQHVARRAVEALARQIAGESAPTHRDLVARPRARRLKWIHGLMAIAGVGSIVAGAFLHESARGLALISAGSPLLLAAAGLAGLAHRRRSE